MDLPDMLKIFKELLRDPQGQLNVISKGTHYFLSCCFLTQDPFSAMIVLTANCFLCIEDKKG